MIWLSFDTETTGIDRPMLVEVGAVLMEDTRERASVSLLVRPDGWIVPPQATAVHGVSHSAAVALGVPLVVAVAALTNLWANADFRVAHNLEFDEKVVAAACGRLGRTSSLPTPPGRCTMTMAAPILALPPTERMIAAGRGDQPKNPSLAECYRHFFGEEPPDAHSALADARAAARVYLAILERL
jgi:DNA polymerase-3 subunit epsilon